MHDKERQITIVINGKERLIPIHEKPNETAKFEQNQIDDFQWVLPDQRSPSFDSHSEWDQPIKIKKKRLFKKKKRHKKPMKKRLQFNTTNHALLKKIWLSVVSAIFIGTSFGMMILMMFAGDNVLSQDMKSDGQVVSMNEKDDTEQTTDLNLNLEVIQGGAFDTMESAEKAAQQLKESGFAAVIDADVQPIRVYIGLGKDKNGAKSIEDVYKQNNQETYIKTVAIESSLDLGDETAELLSEGKQILTMLASEASATFNGEDSEMEATKKREAWQSKLQDEESQIPDNHKQTLTNFSTHLSEADNALHAYTKENKKSSLWKVEQALLDAFIQYKQLISGE